MSNQPSPASARAVSSSGSGLSSSKQARGASGLAASHSASDDAAAAKAERKQRRAAKAAAEAAAAAVTAAAVAAEAESEERAAAEAEASNDEAEASHDELEHSGASDPEDDDGGHASAPEEEAPDVSTPAGMQAALVLLLQQRRADQAQIQQLQAQLHSHAASAVRLGITRSTAAALAPAARSTLRTEADVVAQQQASAVAAPSLRQQQQARHAAERARMPAAPGVQAAMRAAPPRLALPEVKQELAAAALSKEPSLLKSWVFQMERLLGALEDASERPYTFGDRLKVARRHWDQDMEAWWTTLCEARASAGEAAVCSWAGLLAALYDTYAPVSDGLVAGRELQQVKQTASESMEAYVRRVVELQGRVAAADWPSHVVATLALNGVDETRFPWTVSHVRSAMAEFANTRGRPADMAFLAHRLRTQAASEPKVMRGAAAGAGNGAELAAIKAELAKLQRQVAQGASAQAAHMTAAVRTAGHPTGGGTGDSGHAGAGSSGSGFGTGEGADKGRPRSKRAGSKTGSKRMSSAERQRCYDNELCFWCKRPGHISRECPDKAAAKAKQQQQQQGAEGAPSSGN